MEKNPNLGKKLLITGGGRCNVTNNKTDVRTMLHEYKGAGKFLFSTYAQHGVKESIEWFLKRGVEMKEENDGRLFPSTESAKTICDVLVRELKLTGVSVRTKAEVTRVRRETGKHFTIDLKDGQRVTAKALTVATGGTSRPETGSTGDGFSWLAALGHTIVPNNFALVPLSLKPVWVRKLAGITLSTVKLTLMSDGKKQQVVQGKLLFSHVGVTGPSILNMSKMVGELLAHSNVTLVVDLFPNEDAGALKLKLRNLFTVESNKKIKNVLAVLVPSALVGVVLAELDIDSDTPCHSVSAIDRARLLSYLKAMPLPVKGLLGADKAVVSAGGVALPEVNFKTMESRVVPHLFLVGDVLNIDRPSGGYSLQLCWSTGFVAGSHV